MNFKTKNNDFILKFPKVIRIEPSAACNLSCRHCPTGTIDMPRGVMSKKTFSRVIDEIRSNISHIKVIVLYHGGEPLLNKNFIDMLEDLRRTGEFYIKTVSNGMLLTDSIMEGMVKNRLDKIEFSIDGQSPRETEFLRRNSKFSTVRDNIRRLMEWKKRSNSRFPEIEISSVQILNNNGDSNPEMQPPAPDFIIREFQKEFDNNEISISTFYAMVWPHMRVDRKVFNTVDFTNGKKDFCDSVINTTVIRWNGDVVPCCYDLTGKMILGNIHENKLNHIWNNEKYISLRKSIREMNYCELCERCATVNRRKYLTYKNY